MLIRLKIFNTQSSEWTKDEDVDVKTMGDIQSMVQDGIHTFTDRATREPAFSNPEKLVSGDVTLFSSSQKSKAGA